MTPMDLLAAAVVLAVLAPVAVLAWDAIRNN